MQKEHRIKAEADKIAESTMLQNIQNQSMQTLEKVGKMMDTTQEEGKDLSESIELYVYAKLLQTPVDR